MNTFDVERNYFIQIITSLANSASFPNPPKDIAWDMLYKIAARHNLSNMISYGVEQPGPVEGLDPAIKDKFHKDRKIASAREAAQHFAFDEICKNFEENQIHCLPLKGALIKYLYPNPQMRTMADIDILFKDEQTKQVKSLMQKLGYSLENFGGNHDVYIKKPFLNIEMHRRLVSEDSPYSDYLAKTWDRARPENGSKYIWRLSPEDFYIYLFIHLTKHYTKGGTGIRSILDIWLYDRYYGTGLDRAYIEDELVLIKLHEFVKNIRGLSKMWFGGGESCRLYEEMAGYIFTSGVYGTEKQGIISSINNNQGKDTGPFVVTKLRYRLKLFFPGLKHMSILYPFLYRLPFLLPLTWVLRGLKCVLYKNQRTFMIIRNVQSVSEKDLNKINDLHKRAGL